MTKIVSLTLSRGGSKGVPRKNIADICGKPLVAYVLDAAKESKYISERYVSTEDLEIKNVVQSLGAKVIDRPKELASDSAKCEDALLHFAELVDFDILCFIQTTSPLVLPSDLDSGIKKVVSGEYDSVFSTTVETWIPKWIEAGDVVKPVNWTPTKRPRRQQMPELLIENGAFYITTKKQLMESKLRYSGKIGSVEMPLKRSFQIDTTDELELIRSIIKNGVHYD
jgi:CMP-N-acetylneuraminic acid synthetase